MTHMMLGSHYPELDCAEMNGTSSIDGCSLVDRPEAIAIAPEDTYMEGLNLKLADNEDDAGNDHRRTCRITDETDVDSWSESSPQEAMLPHRASSPYVHFRKNRFDSSPVVTRQIEPVINLSLSPLPYHVSIAGREFSRVDDVNLSTSITTALNVAGTALGAGWIDSLAIETGPTAGNLDADTLFSGLRELVCNAPHTEQEQLAHKQLLVQLGDEWRQATAEGGVVYYFNHRTRESQWNLPQGIVRLKVVSQVGKESNGQGGDDGEQRLCSISELDTGVHQTTSPLEYSEIRKKSCDASAITEVGGMDEVGVEYVGHITAKKTPYNGGLLANPLLSSKEKLSLPLAHERLIHDEHKLLDDLSLDAQYPINKLSFEPDLQESTINCSSDREGKSKVVTAYVGSASFGDDAAMWMEAFPDTALNVGQDIYKDGLDDNKADVGGGDCAESPYPQTHETGGNGRFAVNHSIISFPNIQSQVQRVDPIGDLNSIPSRMGEAIPNSGSGLTAKANYKYMDKMGIEVGDETELLTALFCPYCGACLDPHLLASHLTVCHYSSNACMQKLVELALLPREITVINSTVNEPPNENGCEKEDGFRVTNFPEKLKKQPGDSIDQLSNVERCPECNRTFARGRMRVHLKVCHRVFGEKRPVFNGRHKRYQGTPMEFTNATSMNVKGNLSRSKAKAYTSVTTNSTLPRADTSSHSLQQHQHSTSCTKLNGYNDLALGKKKHVPLRRGQREQHFYQHTQIRNQSSSSQEDEQQVQNSVKGGDGVSKNGLCTLCPFCKLSFERKNLSSHFLKCKQLKETRRARSSNLTPKSQCPVEQKASNAHRNYCGRKLRKSAAKNHGEVCQNTQNQPMVTHMDRYIIV